MADGLDSTTGRAARWRDLGRISTAHAVMLRDAGIIDDGSLAALLVPIDATSRGEPADGALDAITAAFDARVDALARPGLVGATTIGRGRAETAATVARLSLRREVLDLARAADDAERALIEFAAQHAATFMPAFAGGQPVQPTTLAHFLGATIGPLGRAQDRILSAYDLVNRSPLGAVALASTSFPISRERVASLLGFDGLVPNTFDAVAAIDHLEQAARAAVAVATPLGRLLTEFLSWLRSEPDSLRLGDTWVSGDPGLPQLRRPTGLERLVLLGHRVTAATNEVATATHATPYEPLGPALDDLFQRASEAVAQATQLATAVAGLINQDIEVNRAYLANRAGRAYTTASELAVFLMTEEGLEPAAAANIAALTLSRARAEGVEISGVTPQMIDAAALMVIGREVGVEIEAISRHLAPRRFLERRTVPGGPAPSAVRDYLAAERTSLDADVRRRLEVGSRVSAAERELDRLAAEAIAHAEQG